MRNEWNRLIFIVHVVISEIKCSEKKFLKKEKEKTSYRIIKLFPLFYTNRMFVGVCVCKSNISMFLDLRIRCWYFYLFVQCPVWFMFWTLETLLHLTFFHAFQNSTLQQFTIRWFSFPWFWSFSSFFRLNLFQNRFFASIFCSPIFYWYLFVCLFVCIDKYTHTHGGREE